MPFYTLTVAVVSFECTAEDRRATGATGAD